MKKILSLFALLMTIVIGAKAADVEVTYALAKDNAFTSGQSVNVQNSSNETVATITYGESGGNDFKAAKEDSQVSGFSAFTEGNGTNGNQTGGTFYTIVPVYDGTIDVAVVLNKDKAFHINEDGTDMEGYAGIKVTDKYYGTYTFTVKAGSSYKVWCDGSKLGFYGFNYTYSDGDTPVGPIDATFSLSKTALKVGETAKVLVNGSDIYGANFNVPTSLWESEAGGPYISLSADGTVTAVKATPASYCFYFFANSKDTEKYVSKQTTTMYIDITEATPVADVYEVTSNNQEFILSQANVTDEANAFVTTSTGDWQTSDQTYGDYPKARYYNMSKTARYMTFKVKGATNFKLNVQNGTAGRTYTVKVGDGEAQTITHGGDALEYSDVFETGSTGEVTITVTGGGSSVYPVSIIFNTTDGSKTFTIGPNGYSTYCGDEKFTVEGATVNTASVNATTGVVTLKAVSIAKKAIEAGVGIVLTGEEGAMITIKPTRNAAASISGNDLVGVNAETTSIDANAYVLSSNDTKTSFIKAGAYGNVTDLMNKAYIVYTGMQEGSLDIQFEGEATAINNVNANDNADSAAPVKVIKNGKLFIGNYNVAGQLVK